METGGTRGDGKGRPLRRELVQERNTFSEIDDEDV